MGKAVSKIYRGIEFVQLSDLPNEQTLALEEWAKGRDVLVKILINNKIQQDCMLYSRYSEWFDLYKQSSADYEEINLNGGRFSESKLVLKTN